MRHDEVEAVRKVELNRFWQRVSISMKVLVVVAVAVIAFSGTTASILKGISPKMGEAVIPVSFGIVFLCFAVLLLWSLFSTSQWENFFERKYVPARLKQDWEGVKSVTKELDQSLYAQLFDNSLVFPSHNRSSGRSMYLAEFQGAKVRIQSLILSKNNAMGRSVETGSRSHRDSPVFEGLAIVVSFPKKVFNARFAFRPVKTPWETSFAAPSGHEKADAQLPELTERYGTWTDNPQGFNAMFEPHRLQTLSAISATMYEASKAGQFINRLLPGNKLANRDLGSFAAAMPLGGQANIMTAAHAPNFPAIGNIDESTMIVLLPMSLTCFHATDVATPIEQADWAKSLPPSLKYLGAGLKDLISLF